MPINFVTGLPRHGKTLYTIYTVKARAEKEKRKVYYCNIPDVSIDGWIEIKHPDEWLDLEDNSIIIVDELQDFWGKQPTGASVPKPILELSKHGKRGFDFYFITQEPNLVHSTPRDLCQTHYYIKRAFGTENAVVRTFDRMQLHPDKIKNKGEVSAFAYPKEAFSWYKSADVHNIKRKIPIKIWLIPIVVIFAIFFVVASYFLFQNFMTNLAADESKKIEQKKDEKKSGFSLEANKKQDAVMSTADYIESFKPRIDGLQYTAPRYDALTQPVNVPFPAACIVMEPKCQCYTNQATKLDIPPNLCRQFAKDGIFQEFQLAVNNVSSAPSPMPINPPMRQ